MTKSKPWIEPGGFVDMIVPPLIALVIVLAVGWHVLGLHIVHKPTAAQLFGCEQTYINDKGEDTGECR